MEEIEYRMNLKTGINQSQRNKLFAHMGKLGDRGRARLIESAVSRRYQYGSSDPDHHYGRSFLIQLEMTKELKRVVDIKKKGIKAAGTPAAVRVLANERRNRMESIDCELKKRRSPKNQILEKEMLAIMESRSKGFSNEAIARYLSKIYKTKVSRETIRKFILCHSEKLERDNDDSQSTVDEVKN